MDITGFTGLPLEAILLLIVGYYVLEIIKTIVTRSKADKDDDDNAKTPVG